MKKRYLQQNVYQALLERLHFIFHEFDVVYVSFSGGKDSGLLLNILLDFRDKFYPSTSIGVFHQDFEAQYRATTEYVCRRNVQDAGKTPRGGIVLALPTDGNKNSVKQL